MNLPWPEAVARLQADESSTAYPEKFFDAFGTTEITADLVSKAIAQFVRTMVSADSKFDRWRRGEVELTDSEYNGYQMFLREGGDPEVVPGGRRGRLFSLPRRSRPAIYRPLVPQQRAGSLL